jgi:hypothetical protein
MWEQAKNTFLDAVDHLLQSAARLLPGIAAMAVLLVLATVVALLVRLLIRKVCARLEVDRRLREWGVAAPAQLGRTAPSRVAERLAGWTILAMGFLVGLNIMESTATSAMALRLLEYVPRAVMGLVVLAVGVGASRAVERSLLIGAVNLGLQSGRLLALAARWLLLIVAGAIALEHLGLGGTILTIAFAILFGGLVLSVSLAVGLGAKDAVARSLERRLQEPPIGTRPPQDDPMHHL